MMNRNWMVLLLVAVALSPVSTPAWGQRSRVGIGVRAGTLGMGAEVIVGLTHRIEMRGGGNYFKLTRNDQDISDISYDLAARWASGSVLADVYVAGPLRLSGGMVLNGNRLSISGKPTANVEIGDSTYTPTQIGTLGGKIDFKKAAPYVGLGLAGRGRVAPLFDVGVVFQGSPQVRYAPTSTLSGAAATAFTQNADKEAVAIQDDLSAFKYYPHVALGMAVRF